MVGSSQSQLLAVSLACMASFAMSFAPSVGMARPSQRVSIQQRLRPAPATARRSLCASPKMETFASEMGLPNVLEKFPKMPLSVHPGVLSGQALIDILEHAKTQGKEFPFLSPSSAHFGCHTPLPCNILP